MSDKFARAGDKKVTAGSGRVTLSSPFLISPCRVLILFSDPFCVGEISTLFRAWRKRPYLKNEKENDVSLCGQKPETAIIGGRERRARAGDGRLIRRRDRLGPIGRRRRRFGQKRIYNQLARSRPSANPRCMRGSGRGDNRFDLPMMKGFEILQTTQDTTCGRNSGTGMPWGSCTAAPRRRPRPPQLGLFVENLARGPKPREPVGVKGPWPMAPVYMPCIYLHAVPPPCRRQLNDASRLERRFQSVTRGTYFLVSIHPGSKSIIPTRHCGPEIFLNIPGRISQI